VFALPEGTVGDLAQQGFAGCFGVCGRGGISGGGLHRFRVIGNAFTPKENQRNTVQYQCFNLGCSATEGKSERKYSAHFGLSRRAIQKARKASRLAVRGDWSIRAAASAVLPGPMIDPDQPRRSSGGNTGFCAPETHGHILPTVASWISRCADLPL
jgi:hypothetical protein